MAGLVLGPAWLARTLLCATLFRIVCKHAQTIANALFADGSRKNLPSKFKSQEPK